MATHSFLWLFFCLLVHFTKQIENTILHSLSFKHFSSVCISHFYSLLFQLLFSSHSSFNRQASFSIYVFLLSSCARDELSWSAPVITYSFIPIYFSVTLLLWSRICDQCWLYLNRFFSLSSLCVASLAVCLYVYLSLIPVFNFLMQNRTMFQYQYRFFSHDCNCSLCLAFWMAILNDWLLICVKLT